MSVRDPRFSTGEHIQALSMRNMRTFQQALGVLKEPRVVQGIQETRKMFTGIKGAASSIFGMVKGFGFLESIMKGIQPLLDMISSLFSALSAGISIGLAPALQQFAPLLETLIPLFMSIGEIIGESLAIGLQIFMEILEAFMPIIEALLPIFIMFMELGLIPLQIILEILTPILEAIEPIIQLIADALEIFAGWLEELEPIIQLIAEGIEAVIGWFTDLLGLFPTGTIEEHENPDNPAAIQRYYEETGRWPSLGSRDRDYMEWWMRTYQGLQEGGDVLSEGLYRLGEGGVQERVKPLPRVEQEMAIQASILGELMEMKSLYRQLLEEKKWRNVFRTIE